MVYGLPVKGQTNYDDELNNSIESVRSDAALAKSTADAANTSASAAKADATAAKATANQALDFVRTTSDDRVAEHVNEPLSATRVALSATYAAVNGERGVWDALTLGAVGDGTTDDTATLQGLADAIATAGGGTLVLPPGHDFAVTQLRLGSNTTLDFRGATLRRKGNTATSTETATLCNDDQATGNSNIRILGGRVVANAATDTGKHVAFDTVNGLVIESLSIERSYGDWAFFARDVDNMTVSQISITGGVADFEDGFHLEGCQNVAVGTLNVSSGDDAVAIVQTTATARVAKNISFGSIVAASRVANILKLEVDPGGPGIEGVAVGNLVGDKSAATVGNCIHIQDQTSTKAISRVSINGAQIDASAGTGYAVYVSHATDVELSGVHVDAPQGIAFDIDNVDRLTMRGCSTRGTRGAGVAGFRLRSVTEFDLAGCRVVGATQHAYQIGGAGMPAVDGSLRGCVARSCTNNGVQLDNASYVNVTENRIKGCAWGIREEAPSCADNYITGNDVRGNTATVSAASGDYNGTYRDGNHGAGNRIHTFAAGDTTPTVKGGNRYHKTANTAATTITALDDGIDGQQIVVQVADANTTFQHSAFLRMAGGTNWTATTNDLITFTRSGGVWIETARVAT